MRSFIGRDLEALTLTRFDGEATEALTDNFLKLLVNGRHSSNVAVRARVDDVGCDGLLGHTL